MLTCSDLATSCLQFADDGIAAKRWAAEITHVSPLAYMPRRFRHRAKKKNKNPGKQRSAPTNLARADRIECRPGYV